jgi:putative transposase
VEEIFYEIAENHEIEIDTLEIAEDHVHLFVTFPPRISISRVVGKLKSKTASTIFREHPEVKRELWGIRNYIEYHRKEEKTPKQLKLF